MASAIYTCPMHLEIERSDPGDCPICGMALESKVPTLEIDDRELLYSIPRPSGALSELPLPGLKQAAFSMLCES